MKSISESLVWELCSPKAKSLNLCKGKYFVEKGAGLSLCFVLKKKPTKAILVLLGGFFVCKQRTFLARRQNCSVALKAHYFWQVSFTIAKALRKKFEIL